MTTPTYGELLANPQWQRRRLQMLERAEWMCQRCLADEEQLHVHHKRYVRGRKPWEYGDDELLVLCSTCHTREHALMEALHELMRDGTLTLSEVVALVGGYRRGAQRLGIDRGFEDYGEGEEFKRINAGVFALGELAGAASFLSKGQVAQMGCDAIDEGIDSMFRNTLGRERKPFDGRSAVVEQ